ncbi:membrane-spanning 4-domains subfamily A member 15 isoform X2 [Tupaia chinensis]|nr:membrane-spanning 4-domains subfamily A member 15 isoform X2 [Tupaia chinensis]
MSAAPASNGVFVVIPPSNASGLRPPSAILPTSMCQPPGIMQFEEPPLGVQTPRATQPPDLRPLETFLTGEPKALGTVQILIGLIHLGFGSVLLMVRRGHVGMLFIEGGVPFWGGACFIISGSLSVAAERNHTSCLPGVPAGSAVPSGNDFTTTPHQPDVQSKGPPRVPSAVPWGRPQPQLTAERSASTETAEGPSCCDPREGEEENAVTETTTTAPWPWGGRWRLAGELLPLFLFPPLLSLFPLFPSCLSLLQVRSSLGTNILSSMAAFAGTAILLMDFGVTNWDVGRGYLAVLTIFTILEFFIAVIATHFGCQATRTQANTPVIFLPNAFSTDFNIPSPAASPPPAYDNVAYMPKESSE